MNTVIRSKIIKIGNSRGIRIPRALLEQAGLTDEVELIVEGDRLIIHSMRLPRHEWAAHFASMAEQGDDGLLDPETSNQFDSDEWTW